MPITGLRGEVLLWGTYLKEDPGSDLGLNRPRVSQTLGVGKIVQEIRLRGRTLKVYTVDTLDSHKN
jgi:hypothetical protein